MSYLLDTHALLWTVNVPHRLSDAAREVVVSLDEVVCVSAVSLWEVSLKFALGKLDLRGRTPEDVLQVAGEAGFVLVDLKLAEVATFYRLPTGEHKDTFDRMLAWQAIQRGLTLVSRDPRMRAYEAEGLRLLW